MLLQISCMLGLLAGGVMSVRPDDARDACPDPLLVEAAKTQNLSFDEGGNLTYIDEETQRSADALSGTCPKGFACSCASCPLYSDLDEDMFCDRGEEPDLV